MTDHLPIPPLPDVVIEPLVRLALTEDFGRGGDITTDAVIPAATRMTRRDGRARSRHRRGL